LIADDHAIVREGLKQILSDIPNMAVEGEASSGSEVMDLVRKGNFGVVLLDISMPGKTGLEVLKQLRDEFPRLPVLILSMYPEEQYAVRVMKAGANGYLTKESAPEQLVNAIHRVAAGGKYISTSLAEQLATALSSDMDKPLHERLSDREYEIFRLISTGLSVSQIADKLALSVKTVSTYRGRVLEKMNMQNNAELTHYAIKYGLVE
jgi:DNA-binding NarL/FixJ family response regulator